MTAAAAGLRRVRDLLEVELARDERIAARRRYAVALSEARTLGFSAAAFRLDVEAVLVCSDPAGWVAAAESVLETLRAGGRP